MEHLVDSIIELQSRANKQIEVYGRVADGVAFDLSRLYDMLTPEQEDELLRRESEIECAD